MRIIPVKVWNRIDMLQQPIAAIAHPSNSKRKRWVAIHYDINRKSIVAYPPHRYCVIDTEFDVALLEKYIEDGDEDLALVNEARYYIIDITELYALLYHLEIDPESFNAPWHVEHPLC
jgi:hypothetical protein